MNSPTPSAPMITLGELIDRGAIDVTSGFPCGDHNSDGAGVLQIRPFNVTVNATIALETQKHVPASAAAGRPILETGDIVFNNTNTKELVGKTAVWNGPAGCVFSNHMTRIRPTNSGLSSKYLASAIHAHWVTGRSEMLARSHVAQASILGERFREIQIPWPTESAQLIFADAFKYAQDSIQIQSDIIETLSALKGTSMRELFTRGVRGEAQKDSEIGPMPESWSLIKTENIFKLTSGKTRPEQVYSKKTPDAPYPVLGGNGIMGFADRWNLDANKALVIGRVGEYCGAVHLSSGKVWITDNALYVKEWLNHQVDIGFVAAFLKYYDLNRFKRMAGQPLVTQGMISEHSLPIPLLDEQQEIAAMLDCLDAKVELHKRKRFVLEELFRAMLHKLMTGELRVTDLDLSSLEDNQGVAA